MLELLEEMPNGVPASRVRYVVTIDTILNVILNESLERIKTKFYNKSIMTIVLWLCIL